LTQNEGHNAKVNLHLTHIGIDMNEESKTNSEDSNNQEKARVKCQVERLVNWSATDCQLLHGDCLEAIKDLPGNSIDMVLIDPPYSTPTVASFGRKVNKRLSDLAIQEFYFSKIKEELERVMTSDAPLFIFCDDIYYAVLVGLFYEWKQINLLVWDKKRIGMGKPFRRRHELLFYANRGKAATNGTMSHIPTILEHSLTKKHHGAEKPVELCEKLIAEFCPIGGKVLDLFMGSGTTGVACKNLNRGFIGMELNKEYFDIATKRIQSS